ncbi:unnamed protein product [Cyprideis torosa]|uniref:Uncharacterized protein n=1 Tax=Cyprideis torosa TaxID=163714 RepID=A0A7R8WCB8_9CRUS|nr:unnamed protein product [Cyprideis torosa]CAG0890565.1 unnamed protein product [Cyprideis torosa]
MPAHELAAALDDIFKDCNRPSRGGRFRADLKALSKKIQVRNEDVAFPYWHLDPKDVPNAISI